MNKNNLWAGILSFLVIFIWFKYFNNNTQKKQIYHPPAQSQKQGYTQNQQETQVQKNSPINTSSISQGTPDASIINIGEEPISDYSFTLENEKSQIIIGKKGEIKSYILKEKNDNTVELIYSNKKFPLTVQPNIIYSQKPVSTIHGKSITIKGKMNNKISVETTYEYIDNDYLMNIRLAITNNSIEQINISNFKLGLGPGLNSDEKIKPSQMLRNMKAYFYSNDKLTKKPKIGLYQNIQNSWIAVDNHYFISAIIDKSNTFDTINVVNKKLPELYYRTDLILKPMQTTEINLNLILGVKNYEYLKSLGNELDKTVSLGLFAPIGKLIMFLLNKFYKLTGNYGFAIILLTTLLQLILLPLNKKSYTSMHAMKRLQPKLENIKKKYKEDPQRLNMEMMALYKKEKVNPFSGCLPLLLQLPIFWALFNTLRNVTALRYAPFIFWIKDLSKPDTVATIGSIPINILPIIMCAMMFISQRLNTGKTTDPMQSKMLIFMPIMFLFMFWNFPSGLVLYWLFSNIYTVCLNLYLSMKNKEL